MGAQAFDLGGADKAQEHTGQMDLADVGMAQGLSWKRGRFMLVVSALLLRRQLAFSQGCAGGVDLAAQRQALLPSGAGRTEP